MSQPSEPLPDARLRLRIADPIAVLQASESIEALLGYPAEDFLSGAVTLARRIHADDQDIAAELFAPQAGGAPRTANLRLRQANGRIRCVKAGWQCQAASDGDGFIILFSSVRPIKLPRM